MSDSGFEWLSWTLYDGVGTKKKKVTTTKYILRTIPIKGVNDQARNQISSSSGALRSYDQVCMTRIMRYRHIVSIRVHSMHRVPWMGDNYRWGRKDDDNNENTLKKHRIISSWRVQSIGLIRGRPFGGGNCLDPSSSRAANAGFCAVCACIVPVPVLRCFFLFLLSPESDIINQQQQENRSRNDLSSVHKHHGHGHISCPWPG